MCLMLMFTVFGKTFSASQLHYSVSKQTKTEQSEKQRRAAKECSVSELSVMQTSSSVTIDISQDFIFELPSITIPVVAKQIAPKAIGLCQNTFYEILFEHFISTNAP
jgi:hypothetical protein